jgi:ribosome recycling factor
MQSTLSSFETFLHTQRTRVHPKILEGITIPLDTKVNLSALGQPSIKDYSTLLFTLSQPQHLQKVDKVLREKGWTTSVVNSHTLKLSLPRMDSKRKSEIQKEIKKESERFKIQIRNQRQEARKELKGRDAKDSKEEEKEIQKDTDFYIEKIDKLVELKLKELQ